MKAGQWKNEASTLPSLMYGCCFSNGFATIEGKDLFKVTMACFLRALGEYSSY